MAVLLVDLDGHGENPRPQSYPEITEDVMVAGFDDIPESRRLPYQLTTVRQPIEQMVDEALNILHLDDPTMPIERGIDRPITGRLIWRSTIPVPPAYRWAVDEERPV